jgi:uroporphyrinogen-III decarboxylase
VDLLKEKIFVRWKYHFTGNFDPSRLLSPIPVIKKVNEMIDEFGKDKYIANLGYFFAKYSCGSR